MIDYVPRMRNITSPTMIAAAMPILMISMLLSEAESLDVLAASSVGEGIRSTGGVGGGRGMGGGGVT